ncbi:FliM/FliN family flagellar motor switch protein [Vibrio coralliilyticus]|uniref:FliM/FliN family flagellar motor switch protein n=1 Tax=Vibrio coralliilyticus TaxID=190893 RepID=UPI001833A254|nr:FliM/FliN family flagellar motor switch protein [Vibrio coralliilyticus]NUW68057.1 FliM/FliN family flagellar motor switch protein [Vibrio coralliilyticus]
MRIAIDVVVANCVMTLDELNQIKNGQIKEMSNFFPTQVMLKSGNQLIATGTLIKVEEQYCVSIDKINSISQ